MRFKKKPGASARPSAAVSALKAAAAAASILALAALLFPPSAAVVTDRRPPAAAVLAFGTGPGGGASGGGGFGSLSARRNVVPAVASPSRSRAAPFADPAPPAAVGRLPLGSRPLRWIPSPLALSSSPSADDDTDDNGEGEGEDAETYDWMSGGPDRPSPAAADGGGEKKKRRKIRDFFSSSSDKVQPFDIEGNAIEPPSSSAGAGAVRPKFDALFGDGRMPGLDDILGGAAASSGEASEASSGDSSAEETGDAGGAPFFGRRKRRRRTSAESMSELVDDIADDLEDYDRADDDDGVDHHPDDVLAAERAFASFASSMRSKIAEQRLADPESVPSNAEVFLEGVVGEMRAAKLAELGTERREREMREYEESKRREMLEGKRGGGAGEEDAVVREVLGEAEVEATEKERYEGRVEDFRDYERRRRQEEAESAEAASMAAATSSTSSSSSAPVDVDEQALAIMEDLLARRTAEEEEFERRLSEMTGDDIDIPEWDTDNLEDGIRELKRDIEAKKKAREEGAEGSDAAVAKPETMKEWQMYRSISSKTEERTKDKVDEEVANKMREWREFQEKETEMRRSAGLTKGARMPFAWSDRPEVEVPDKKPASGASTSEGTSGGGGNPPAFEIKDPDRVRLEYDRAALRALRSLADATYDPYRAGKLKEEVSELEAEIAELEEKIRTKPPPAVVEAEEEEGAPPEPVDVSDIFGGGRSIFEREEEVAGSGSGVAAAKSSEPLPPPPPPPDSPFFADSFEEDAVYVDEELPSVPEAPDTPFFRGDDDEASATTAEEDDYGLQGENGDEDDGEEVESLGSIEEQKLRSMARRAGVRSVAEEERLRKEWEEFQKFEKSSRDRAGLSGGGEDPNLRRGVEMDYALGEVVKDGDVDAERILESIGERPGVGKKRGKSGGGSDDTSTIATPAEEGSYEQYLQYEKERMEQQMAQQQQQGVGSDATAPPEDVNEDDHDDEDVIVYQKRAARWDGGGEAVSVSDQLYRSLASRGRGDEEGGSKDSDRAAFEEYLQKEEEMRRAVMGDGEGDGVSSASSTVSPGEGGEDLGSVEAMEDYAEDVLEELGPRPKASLSRKRDRDASVYSDLSDDDDEDDEEDDDDILSADAMESMRDSVVGGTPSTSSDQLPDWVRREQEERRKEEFMVSDDAVDGRDDADYATTDYDDRLDDLDYETKQKQAEEFERRTSGREGRPAEVSLSDVFGRDYFGPDDEPDDYYSLGGGRGRTESFSSFERRKKDLMDYSELSVAELNSLMDYRDEETGDGASKYMKKVRKPYREFGAIFRLEQLLVDVTGLNFRAWKRTAEKYGFDVPEVDSVRVAAAHRAEFAVQRVFYWTDDFLEGREMARTQRAHMAEAFGEWLAERGIEHKPTETKKKVAGSFDLDLGLGDAAAPPPKEEEEGGAGSAAPVAAAAEDPAGGDDGVAHSGGETVDDDSSAAIAPSEAEFLAMQHEAWTKTAEYFRLQAPTLQDVEATTFLSPEDVVTKLFQWTTDDDDDDGGASPSCREIVAAYSGSLKAATDRWAAKFAPEDLSKMKKVAKKEESPVDAATDQGSASGGGALSEDDMLEMQLFSWTAAAESNGLESPSLEQVQMASWVSPEEAVRKVFQWSSDDDDEAAARIAAAYGDAMKKISDIYIKKKNLQVEQADTSDATTEQVPARPSAPTEEDVLRLQVDVWSEVARRNAFEPPNADEVQLATFGSPDEAVIRVFKWTDDAEKSREIAAVFSEVMGQMSKEFLEKFNPGGGQPGAEVTVAGTTSEDADDDGVNDLPLFVLNDGAIEWLETLREVEMPCAVLSHLDRRTVDVVLDRTGLAHFFPPERRVTVENAYRGEIDELLGAALRLERRPDHCATFDVTPGSAVSAHENGMRNVAMIGLYANYDLLAADMTAKYFDQFRAQNLRGLFSDVRLDEPQEELQRNLPEAPKPSKTRFWEEGDRS